MSRGRRGPEARFLFASLLLDQLPVGSVFIHCSVICVVGWIRNARFIGSACFLNEDHDKLDVRNQEIVQCMRGPNHDNCSADICSDRATIAPSIT